MLLLLLTFPFFLPAQSFQYLENPIILNREKGVDVGGIKSVTVDKNGFLWIGGYRGLQRYDGNQFKKYEPDPNDSLSIGSTYVSHLFYDENNHQIWIAHGEKGGLSILDLETETFKKYFKDSDKSTGVSQSLRWSYKDKFNNFWVSVSTKGLGKYLPESDSFQSVSYQLLASEKQLDVERPNNILGYSPDQFNDSLLWLGSLAGLLRFNVVTHEFTRFPLLSPLGKEFSIRTLLHHTDNQIYASTWHDGMYRFDPTTEQFFKCPFEGFSEQSGAKNNSIYSIRALSNHKLLIKTQVGFFEYNSETQKVIDFKRFELRENVDFTIDFEDKTGRKFFWNGGDIYLFDPLRQQVQTYIFEPEDKEFNFITRRILEDEKTGKLWLAPQMSKGLLRVDLKTNTWEVFPPPEGYFNHNKIFACWDILKTQKGEFLVVESDAIYQFLEKEKKLVLWEIQPQNEDGTFRSILQDRTDNIWIGTKGNGVFKIEANDKTIRHYKEELLTKDKKSTGDMWRIQEDRNGNIWMIGKGYSVYDVQRDSFYIFPFFRKEIKQSSTMEGMEKDSDGNIWIASIADFNHGTVGDIGITDADHPEKGIVKYLDQTDGIKGREINAFYADDKKNMWLVSKFLEKISPDQKYLQSIAPSFLGGREYTYITKLSDGKVVMGCRKGVGIVNLDSLRVGVATARPYIQNFKVFDKPINLATSPNKLSEVYLKANENFFSFEISALNPAFYGYVEFQYKLEGVDPDWVLPDARRYVAYTNVGGGTYTFKLRAKNDSNIWMETPYELRIHIATPWYKSIWAYTAAAILFFGITFFIYRAQYFKKIAQQESNRLKELDDFKTRFYSNITHEFRTPLTVISGMSDELKINPNQEREKKLHLIKKNSQNLLVLVNQMLDLSKLKVGKKSTQLQQSDIILFLKYLTESHESFAKLRNVGLQFYSEEKKLMMDFDARDMEQMLNNLISNAVKFTPKYGKILVVAKKYFSGKQPFLEIKVKDTGIGISEEQLPFIFDRFHQANPTHENQGSGIGLALVKELVTASNGMINVESEPEKGSIFYLNFPITNNALIVVSPERFAEKTPEFFEPTLTELSEISEEGLPILLIIEDNADVVYYLKTCLKDSYQIYYSKNGKLGIEKAFEILPDIIISDVMMPEADGLEVCKILKEDERTDHIPIILLTAKATSTDKLEGLKYGADAYLTKPFEKEELTVRLEKLRMVREKMQLKYSSELISQKKKTAKPKTKEEQFIEKLESVILSNLEDEDFSVTNLARALLLSRSQVHRKIKALTGMSTAIYIRHVRLEKAKTLLRETNNSISEIAYLVGFKTPVYFSQVFKETTGESPTDWRSG